MTFSQWLLDINTDDPLRGVPEGDPSGQSPSVETAADSDSDSDNGFEGPETLKQVDPVLYDHLVRETQDQWGFTAQSQYKPRLDFWIEEYREEFNDWPSYLDLQGWDRFNNSMYGLASGLTYVARDVPFFTHENQWYSNDPFFGPQAVETTPGGLTPSFLRTVGGADMSSAELQFLARHGQVAPEGPELADLSELLRSLSPVRSSGRRGSGRQAMAFDRAHLLEQAQDRWRGLMLETPDAIEGIVDDYMSQANSFWMRKGGQLNFDTFLVNKMRETTRYKTLYGRKPQHQSEEEYMAQFRSAVGRFGLNPRAERREVEAGLQSGAGAAGFTERVSRVREVQNQAGFSQRLAQTVAGLGSIVRS